MASRRIQAPVDPKQRQKLLQRWYRARRDGRRGSITSATNAVLRQFESEGLQICARTLYRWDLLYQGKGLAGLRDGRTGPRHTPADPFLDLVARLYFARKTVRLCYELAKLQARERGIDVAPYRACARAMARLRAGKPADYTRR